MKRKLTVLLFAIAITFPLTIVTTMALQNEEAVSNTKDNVSTIIEESSVTPQEKDFVFLGTTLTGISSTFLNGLSDVQKQNIHLLIPDKTTVIGSGAFWKSSGLNKECNYISLDLSMANKLVEIGNNAFYGCNKISGSLVIPDTVKSIGTHVFDGCSSLTGTLTLSNQLMIISDHAFYNCGFKGTLIIPSSVTTIGASAFRQSNSYMGFTGELIIPNSVISIGTVAFFNQSDITSVVLSNQLTVIPQSAFRGTGLQGVLVLPNTIQKIDATAFASTKLETVYLSKRMDSNNTSFIQSTSFDDCSKLMAIVCDKVDYSYIYGTLSNKTKTKVGYPMAVRFNDSNNGDYTVLECLYKQSYQLQKDSSNKWKMNTEYTFPKVIGDENKKWSLNAATFQVVKETEVAVQENLYAITPLENPAITFSEGIDKIYDGKEATLQIKSSHPLAKKIEDAKIGDVVFYYTWTWDIIGSRPVVLEGFDEDSYGIKDVREPRFAIGCSVKVKACLVNSNYKAVSFYTIDHTFSVGVKQQDSNVHPLYPNDQILVSNGLPSITLSSNDTKGTIAFDEGQTLVAGQHSYTWTFIPEKNDVGNSNYTIVKGAVKLDAVDKFTHTLTINKCQNGTIEATNTIADRGTNVNIKVLAKAGYVIDCLYSNDIDITKDIKDNVYILKNIQENHIIYATFKALPLEDVEDVITDIPEITTETITEEQRIEVLDTVEYFLTLDKELQDKIAPEIKHQLYQTIAQLPQVQIETMQPRVSVLDNEMLLQILTAQEVEILLNNKDAKLTVAVNVNEMVPTIKQQQQIDATLQGGKVCQTLDIDIQKELTSNDTKQATTITNLSVPMQFSFIVPSTMPNIEKGYMRSMFVIRVHEQGGVTETAILEDEDSDDSKITISTDKFSCYVLAYYDSLVAPPDTTIEAPSNTIVNPGNTIVNPGNTIVNPGNTIVNPSNTKEQTSTLQVVTMDNVNIENNGILLLISMLGIVVCVIKKPRVLK